MKWYEQFYAVEAVVDYTRMDGSVVWIPAATAIERRNGATMPSPSPAPEPVQPGQAGSCPAVGQAGPAMAAAPSTRPWTVARSLEARNMALHG